MNQQCQCFHKIEMTSKHENAVHVYCQIWNTVGESDSSMSPKLNVLCLKSHTIT